MVSGKYRFSVDELLVANSHAIKEQARRSLLNLIIPLGIGLLLVAVFLLDDREAPIRVGLGILGAYFLLFRLPLITRMMVRRQFSKRSDQNIEITYEASDEGMIWTTDHSTSSFRWSLVSKARRFKDGYLIFSSPSIFHWIPNHSLVFQIEIEALSKLFQTHIQDYRILD